MMKKLCLIAGFFLAIFNTTTAQVEIDPVITPSSFNSNTEITVVYDVTGTSLASLENVYLWTWIPNGNKDAKYNINPASSDPQLTEFVKFNKNVADGNTTFTLTFTPQDLFADPICDATQIGMLLKGNNWSDGQTKDYVTAITPLENCFVATLLSPTNDPAFVIAGNTIDIKASSSEFSVFTLSVNGNTINTQAGINNYSYTYHVNLASGTYPVALSVAGNNGDSTLTFDLFVNEPSQTLARPSGIIPGINYHESDDTKVTLCLLAPNKKLAFVLSEINDYQVNNAYKMYKDGDYFWLEITGLTPGKEYAYQYFVDGHYVADPFADKILDPDDQWIPESIYPNLKPYPTAALRGEWFYNRLSVFETGQSDFNWQHLDYTRPKKEDLVVYELLIRDFFAPDNRSYQNLIDTLSYLERLGVNAIELMPVMEFNGNDSWGYNPNFMFAVDKAYGTREGFKQFIDAAHARGMAVILDIVLNQQEYPNPYLVMYTENGQLAADNPMFNREARHPFNVFVDMNHESPYTQYYVDTVCNYWINEYKVDGFRFDLSKGFTQNATTDVGVWSAKDDSRIALLKRMGDEIWSYDPDSWLILEHFAANDEEKILADYGFMFWGNIHNDYKEAVIGFPDNKSIAWAYHETRNWNEPNLLSYMESHDEERQMVDAINNGNESGLYKITDENTALERMKLGAAFFLTVPGPKMLWQFQ
ncbi:MAG: alpha-amylase family glycosyl hydrolase, partial [Cyclobacteriaceae bacterium]